MAIRETDKPSSLWESYLSRFKGSLIRHPELAKTGGLFYVSISTTGSNDTDPTGVIAYMLDHNDGDGIRKDPNATKSVYLAAMKPDHSRLSLIRRTQIERVPGMDLYSVQDDYNATRDSFSVDPTMLATEAVLRHLAKQVSAHTSLPVIFNNADPVLFRAQRAMGLPAKYMPPKDLDFNGLPHGSTEFKIPDMHLQLRGEGARMHLDHEEPFTPEPTLHAQVYKLCIGSS